MVEHLCSQQAALTKVIATAILSPEQVASIIQSEKGGDKVGGDVRGEGDVEEVIRVEASALGAKEKV